MILYFCFSVLSNIIFSITCSEIYSSLPLFPEDAVIQEYREKFHHNLKCNTTTRIPCFLWMTTKNVSELQPMYSWIPPLIERNPDWYIRIVDDTEMINFMETVFRGTKLLWAFNKINPVLPPVKTDIWRYAVLYVYGGGYIDTDSNIYTPLRKVVRPDDSFLFGIESRRPTVCYHTYIHQANRSASSRLPNTDYVQWFFFSEPGHPFLKRMMENIARLVELEYEHKSALTPPDLFNKIICLTGPGVFTHSIMEVDTELNGNVSFRACGRHFNHYETQFKMLKNRQIPFHYSAITYSRRSKTTQLLQEYIS
mmetsp:Transcript_5300/g.5446  ORF Transcript_5300/g.5446 Transcript_5300/m.5446 type:complete len:310 (+) Transcript_5300:315-1244(+)